MQARIAPAWRRDAVILVSSIYILQEARQVSLVTLHRFRLVSRTTIQA